MAEMIAPVRPTERLRYTVADMDWLAQLPEYADRHFELIEGELREMAPVGEWHGSVAINLIFYLKAYVDRQGVGRLTTETGYYALDDDETLLAPDIAFRKLDTMTNPPVRGWVEQMPDLAVEIKSPRDTFAHMRRKAELYLRRGTQIVWLVYPERRGVDVCALDEAGAIVLDFIDETGSLSGGDALPGFVLELRRLFA